jgi:hypothetical protein
MLSRFALETSHESFLHENSDLLHPHLNDDEPQLFGIDFEDVLELRLMIDGEVQNSHDNNKRVYRRHELIKFYCNASSSNSAERISSDCTYAERMHLVSSAM